MTGERDLSVASDPFQIHEYVQELNSLESRRRKKKLDMNNVVYWFKNARAAQKRSEYRKFCNIPASGAKKNCNVLKIPLGFVLANFLAILNSINRRMKCDEKSSASPSPR